MTNPGTQNGAVGDSVALQIQSGGLPSDDSWTYAATGLPSGLSINTNSGQIDGTITGSANAYSVSVTASDGQGASASQSFTWNVSTLSVTNPGTHEGAVGDSASLQFRPPACPAATLGSIRPPACRRACPSTPARARSTAPSLARRMPTRSRSRPATARAPAPARASPGTCLPCR